MIRPDFHIFGYRIITIDDDDKKSVVQMFLKNNMSVKFYGNEFIVKERDFKKICSLLGTRVKFSASEMKGLLGFLYSNRKRFGALCAVVFTVFLILASSEFVWDIRVEGCESGNEKEILSELSDAGFSVGSLWRKTDKSKIEVELLSSSDYVAWVNINRRGNVAYVKVVDKIVKEEPEVKSGYSNIIASCDGVIEEITVIKGVAVVKAGDTVKRGELLISGILPSDSGGGFCYAEGVVFAKTNHSLEVEISQNTAVKVKSGEKLRKISLNILGFDINIFKSYGNLNKEYDIINKKNNLSFFGSDIPISYECEYAELYSPEIKKLSHDEMTKKASLAMADLLAERTANSTLLRVKTYGEFIDDKYVLHSDITVSENIAKNLAFEAHIQ